MRGGAPKVPPLACPAGVGSGLVDRDRPQFDSPVRTDMPGELVTFVDDGQTGPIVEGDPPPTTVHTLE